MDWIQVLIIVALNIGLILWSRLQERSNSDQLQQKTLKLVARLLEQVQEIHLEIKIFRGRLWAIEQKNKK